MGDFLLPFSDSHSRRPKSPTMRQGPVDSACHADEGDGKNNSSEDSTQSKGGVTWRYLILSASTTGAEPLP